jgi:hypothetical protein
MIFAETMLLAMNLGYLAIDPITLNTEKELSLNNRNVPQRFSGQTFPPLRVTILHTLYIIIARYAMISTPKSSLYL